MAAIELYTPQGAEMISGFMRLMSSGNNVMHCDALLCESISEMVPISKVPIFCYYAFSYVSRPLHVKGMWFMLEFRHTYQPDSHMCVMLGPL